jgi:hypothetical protein
MSVLSGKYAAVDGISTTTQWTLTDSSTPAEARTSNTRSGTSRVPGIRDWTGTMAGHGEYPPVMPGQKFNFIGYTAPYTGVFNTPGDSVVGVGIVDEVTMTWDWTTSSLLSYTVSFASGEGQPISRAPDGTVTDDTLPTLFSMCPIKTPEFKRYDDQVWTSIPNVTSLTLTITANNPTYNNASTGCDTGRTPGIIDWTLAMGEQTTSPIDYPVGTVGTSQELPYWAIGDDVWLRLYTTNTRFWELRSAHIVDFSDLTCDNDTGDIIAHTVNFGMHAGKVEEGSLGAIILPDSTEYWPTQVLGLPA